MDSARSRKRSHAEITRSESRSQSPQPPSKRRRTLHSPHHHLRTSSNSESSTIYTDSTRYPGDGLDYRRPVMSTGAISQPYEQDTIDLTLEDDSPPPRQSSTNSHSTATPIRHTRSLRPNNAVIGRAPPFPSHDEAESPLYIDLSSDDGNDAALAGGGTALAPPSSPEVQFMGARTVPRPPDVHEHGQRRPHLPTPPAMGHFGSMVNFVRGMTQNYFVNLRAPRELPEETLNRLDGLLRIDPMAGRDIMPDPPSEPFDEYDGLQMDYGQAAFNVGADVLLIEDPNLHNHLPNRMNEFAYKEPAPAREGFTRNYDEDDMLICGFCGDELATGKTEQKQQVWIVKQCGHAYCGDCAHNRNISKNKNNRDTKRTAGKKVNNFKICNVPGCSKAVDSKTKMFQIYL